MRRRRAMLRCCLALTAVLIAAAAPADANAMPEATLHASFIPYRLNTSTTLKFGFDITSTTGAMPPPLVSIDLHLPAGINQNASELGLDICRPEDLARLGPSGCPVNSQVGFGAANVEAEFGGSPVREKAYVSTFAGPVKSPSELLFYNEARTPIASRLVYFGQAREESGLFSGDLETIVPLIPTVPEGGYLATTSFESTLGPLGLTYQRKIHGRTESFHPAGIFLPKRCPAKGFPFLVELRFADGTEAADRSTVPCPTRN